MKKPRYNIIVLYHGNKQRGTRCTRRQKTKKNVNSEQDSGYFVFLFMLFCIIQRRYVTLTIKEEITFFSDQTEKRMIDVASSH